MGRDATCRLSFVMPSPPPPATSLVDAIDAVLPQTQCTRCGYPDCRGYAAAVAAGEAGIGQCPPGGAEGVRRLASLTGRPVVPLDAAHGEEGPLMLAVIDEDWCIGCTLCIKACPVDAVMGTNKRMHTVIEPLCTGCELCVPACPVDCIAMVPAHAGEHPPTGWAAWSPRQADAARARYRARGQRLVREKQEHEARLQAKAEHKLAHLAEESRLTDPAALERKRTVIEAALARARQRRSAG
ncbi:MAG: electron transport complex subunit RsxB [Pseudomonadota bacterium]